MRAARELRHPAGAPTVPSVQEVSVSTLHRMFDTHPEPAGPNGAEALRCIEAAAACAQACTVCADACLGEEDVKAMVTCIRLDLDCAEVCRVTATLLARPSHRDAPALRAQLQACAEMCRACGEECARHGEHGMEHCRICAEACHECAEACDAMAAALVP
jgi:hypothetical protein